MLTPTVSVIIPTFNRASLLPRALRSVIAQTFEDWEIILVDDGSTDGTPDVARRFGETLADRLVYIRQANGGASRARNRGIDEARGRFVAFLDCDDEFLPEKLERQLALFEARPELGLVYSDFAAIDADGARIDSAFDTNCSMARAVAHEAVAPKLCVCTRDLFNLLLREYFIATIVGMVRRDVLNGVGAQGGMPPRGSPGGTIRFAEDQAYAEEWLFYLNVARSCRAGFVDEPLCVHHHVRGSLARTDRRRNARRFHQLLLGIGRSFHDLSPDQRVTLRGHLARSSRQLGYNALREGEGVSALRFFANTLAYEPSPRSVRDVISGAAQSLSGGSLWGRHPGGSRSAAGDPVALPPRGLRQARTLRNGAADAVAQLASPARTDAVPHDGAHGDDCRSGDLPEPSKPRKLTTQTQAPVWDRVWRHRPDAARDDRLIAREHRSPRWSRIRRSLESAYGTLSGLRTIELGSGRGDLSVLLARHGAEVTLLDASDKALDQARRRFHRLGLAARYVRGNFLGDLDAVANKFDVSLSSGVIEHFRGAERTRTIRTHYEVLQPRGMAIISVPHAACIPYRLWKLYLELRGWWPYGMEIPYSRRELARRAFDAGLRNIETCCLGFWQSVGDHWGRSLLGRGPDWVDRPSRLDGVMGANLLMFGRRMPSKKES